MGVRALAKKHHVHRRTVRQALANAVPPERKVAERRCPVLDAWKPLIQAWVTTDERLPKKQRHTAHRVWERLVAEHGARVGESTVRKYVARLRRELGGGVGQVAVPQVHRPGEEAEVDFAELWVWLEGALTKLWLFTMRLSCSGRAVHRAFATQAQEAFLRATLRGSPTWAGCPTGSVTTTSAPRWRGSSRAATASRMSGSSRCAATTGSTRSFASPA